GNSLWLRQAGGPRFDDLSAVVVNSSGEAYVAGGLEDSATFGHFDIVSPSVSDEGFLAKLDAAGNFVWAEWLGGTSGDRIKTIDLGPGDEMVLSGDFTGTVDFDFGPETFSLTGVGTNSSGVFLCSLDASQEFAASFCFGNVASCPCGNSTETPGGGCQNSAGRGAVLHTNGETSILANNLSFDLEGGLPSSFGVLMSADNRLGGGLGDIGLPVTDGLRCVGGNGLRHGTRGMDSAGDSLNPWGTGVGIVAQSGFAVGQTRHFQVRYREDPQQGPCGSDQNTSQGVSILFVP
ncbi:MAG: hypothetical protein AAF368_04620, partial [Planctomycetota bacterium]